MIMKPLLTKGREIMLNKSKDEYNEVELMDMMNQLSENLKYENEYSWKDIYIAIRSWGVDNNIVHSILDMKYADAITLIGDYKREMVSELSNLIKYVGEMDVDGIVSTVGDMLLNIILNTHYDLNSNNKKRRIIITKLYESSYETSADIGETIGNLTDTILSIFNGSDNYPQVITDLEEVVASINYHLFNGCRISLKGCLAKSFINRLTQEDGTSQKDDLLVSKMLIEKLSEE